MFYSTYIKRRAVSFDKHIEYLENKIHANQEVKKLGVRVPILYYVLDKVDELKNIEIPEKCVIKFNNLSCSNGIVIRKNKKFLKYENVKEVIDYLKKFENQKPVGQRSIHKIKQKIMVEELLEPCTKILYDIKCFCFYGEVKFIHVIHPQNRTECFMYNPKGFLEYIYKKDIYAKNNYIEKPKYFFDIIKKANKVATHLTKDYALRIDFYSTNKGAMFGEFTFNPSAGNGLTEYGDKTMGSFLQK